MTNQAPTSPETEFVRKGLEVFTACAAERDRLRGRVSFLEAEAKLKDDAAQRIQHELDDERVAHTKLKRLFKQVVDLLGGLESIVQRAEDPPPEQPQRMRDAIRRDIAENLGGSSSADDIAKFNRRFSAIAAKD